MEIDFYGRKLEVKYVGDIMTMTDSMLIRADL